MKKKLLLHSCCAPCTSGVLHQLTDYDITLFFYNPNLDTLDEYNRRLQALRDYIAIYNEENQLSINIIAPEYNHDPFKEIALGLENEKEGGTRCQKCIGLRLKATAEYAKAEGYDLFASTLSVSPHKDHELINRIGDNLSQSLNLEYLPSNFKKNNGFLISIQNSKKYNIYRQTYCGCNPNNFK